MTSPSSRSELCSLSAKAERAYNTASSLRVLASDAAGQFACIGPCAFVTTEEHRAFIIAQEKLIEAISALTLTADMVSVRHKAIVDEMLKLYESLPD